MCIFFIINEYIVIFNFSLYSFTTTGLLGIFSIIIYGLYTSMKGRPELSFAKHFSFPTGITLIAVVIYLVVFAIATKLFG